MRYQLHKPEGRKYYNLTFTDPKTHERVKESTGCELKGEAEAWVFQYWKTYQIGKSKAGAQTIGELMDTMLAHYETHMPGRWEKMQQAWDNRMVDKFAGIEAREFSFSDVEDYKTWCGGGKPKRRRWDPIGSKLKQSTINRDLATLSRLFSFSQETKQITFVGPKFIRYSEKAFVRKGYVTQAEFDALVAQNPPLWLRAMMEVAYNIANRRGELVNLRVRQCDFLHEMVRLDGDDTKNEEGRDGPMTPLMKTLLMACCEGKGPEDHVFTRDDRNGPQRPIGDFRCIWRKLLQAAGIERNILIHDFRRSAVTNMIQRGVDRDTARKISGHKTEAVFSRYNIVNARSVKAAAAIIQAGAEAERKAADKSVASKDLQAKPEATKVSKTSKSIQVNDLQGLSPNWAHEGNDVM